MRLFNGQPLIMEFLQLSVSLPPYSVKYPSVAQLVEALRYKPEGRGFDSRWCHWKFSLT